MSTYLITAVAGLAMLVAIIGWTSHAGASRNNAGAASHTRPAIDSMLLRADDVPSEYSQSPQPFSKSDYPFYDAAGGEIPSPTVKGQIMFQKGLIGPFIYNSIAVYNNVDALFEAYSKAAKTCGRDGTGASVSFTATSFPTIGDRTFAASFSGSAAGFSYTGELVLVSKGNVASLIVILGSPTADTTQLETYARVVESRMSWLSMTRPRDACSAWSGVEHASCVRYRANP